MPYNEHLAERIGGAFNKKGVEFELKKMFGGMCFMVDDKMCLGVLGDDLMVRLDPEIYEASLKRKGCRAMDFTGRPMKGYVFVDAEGTDSQKDLQYWLQKALDFNPKAKKSPKKKAQS